MSDTATTEESLRRIHLGVLADAEKRLLLRLADHLPASVTPDHLTALGVVGAGLVLAGCLLAHWNASFLFMGILGLATNWFGDSLDGTLARRRGIERPLYGFYIDQFSDVAGHLMILVGLGLSPLMRLDTALLSMLASLLTMFYGHLRLPFDRTWMVSQHAMGPTELRILIGVGLLVGALFGIPSLETRIGVLSVFDAVGVVAFVGGLFGIAVRFREDRPRFAAADTGARPDEPGPREPDGRAMTVDERRRDATEPSSRLVRTRVR